MSSSSSNTEKPKWRWSRALILPAWVLISLIVSQVLIALIIALLKAVHLNLESLGLNATVLNTIISILVYAITLTIVILVPLKLKKVRTSRKELGITDLPSWTDILLAPPSFIVYALLTAALASLAVFLPWYDATQAQDTGFSHLSRNYEYILALFSLVVLAPIAEEILFRGYLLGKLRKHVPVWLAVLITSLVFAVAHGAWNVGIDVFALSIVLCLLRIMTGSIWASVLVHMIKNGIAFYILFINPMLLPTMGG